MLFRMRKICRPLIVKLLSYLFKVSRDDWKKGNVILGLKKTKKKKKNSLLIALNSRPNSQQSGPEAYLEPSRGSKI